MWEKSTMKQFIFSTQQEWTGFFLRCILGGVMLPHGAQKLLGSFGGYGYQATMNFFTASLKLPWIIAFLVIMIEFFGAIGLIVGFASRVWAALFITIMIGAIITTNFQHGLFMNWFGNQAGEGFEYHLLVIGICMALLLTGSGIFSIDRVIVK